MTDPTNKPIDDSKEELTEAELDQVAGGVGREAHPAVRGGEASPGVKTHTDPEKIPHPAPDIMGMV
jgi:hypothetical protein